MYDCLNKSYNLYFYETMLNVFLLFFLFLFLNFFAKYVVHILLVIDLTKHKNEKYRQN